MKKVNHVADLMQTFIEIHINKGYDDSRFSSFTKEEYLELFKSLKVLINRSSDADFASRCVDIALQNKHVGREQFDFLVSKASTMKQVTELDKMRFCTKGDLALIISKIPEEEVVSYLLKTTHSYAMMKNIPEETLTRIIDKKFTDENLILNILHISATLKTNKWDEATRATVFAAMASHSGARKYNADTPLLDIAEAFIKKATDLTVGQLSDSVVQFIGSTRNTETAKGYIELLAEGIKNEKTALGSILRSLASYEGSPIDAALIKDIAEKYQIRVEEEREGNTFIRSLPPTHLLTNAAALVKFGNMLSSEQVDTLSQLLKENKHASFDTLGDLKDFLDCYV